MRRVPRPRLFPLGTTLARIGPTAAPVRATDPTAPPPGETVLPLPGLPSLPLPPILPPFYDPDDPPDPSVGVTEPDPIFTITCAPDGFLIKVERY